MPQQINKPIKAFTVNKPLGHLEQLIHIYFFISVLNNYILTK